MDENNLTQGTPEANQQPPAQQAQPSPEVQQPAAQQPAAQRAQYQQGYQQGYQQVPPSGQQQGNPYAYQQQPGQQWQQPYGNQQYAPVPPAPFENNSTMYIVLSVLEFLFCGGLLAIIPFVFSLQYRDAYITGNFDQAAVKKKNAKVSLIVVLAVSLALMILSFVLLFAMLIPATQSSAGLF